MAVSAPAGRAAAAEPNRWAVLSLLSVAQLMVVLDATIVTIALPSAQKALGFSTESRQWIVTAYALAFGSLLLLGGKLGDLFGRKWTLIGGVTFEVLTGMTLGAIGMFLFTRLTPDSSYAAHVLPGLIVLGVGMGCIFAPAFSTATLGVDGKEAGVASAMVNTSQQVGGSVGTALLSTIFASAVTSYATSHAPSAGLADAAAVHGYTTAFWWSVGIFVLGFILAMVILPGRSHHRVPTAKAALARLAVGNCHHFESRDGAHEGAGATTGAGGR